MATMELDEVREQELGRVRALLLARRKELQGTSRRTVRKLRQLDQCDPDRRVHPRIGDDGYFTEGYDGEDIQLGLIDPRNADVAEINLALEKLDEGTYGICEDCVEPIPPKRLQCHPQATLCVGCKGKRERLAK